MRLPSTRTRPLPALLFAGLCLAPALGCSGTHDTAHAGASSSGGSGSSAAGSSRSDASIRPGANAPFLSPDLDVQKFVETFEGESREIAAQRQGIALYLGLQPGMAVADIGAGTGLFMEELAHGVGPTGKVYAVDLAPGFVAHLRERAAKAQLKQVQVVQCSDHSTELPAASIDVAFVCDTFHHLEYPAAVLASLRSALKPGGLLVVVDFERRPDSRAWVLEHVRCGSEQVIAEIEAAGFRLVDQPAVAGLAENYLLRFRKR